MDVEKRVAELGIELPASSPAKALYIPAKRVGSTLYVSGQIPMLGGEMPLVGRAGAELTLEQVKCFYNRLRLHSALGYMSPVEFEEAHAKQPLAA